MSISHLQFALLS